MRPSLLFAGVSRVTVLRHIAAAEYSEVRLHNSEADFLTPRV